MAPIICRLAVDWNGAATTQPKRGGQPRAYPAACLRNEKEEGLAEVSENPDDSEGHTREVAERGDEPDEPGCKTQE